MSKSSGLLRQLATVLLLIVLAPPAVLAVSIYGTRSGVWDIQTGYGLLGLQVVPTLSWIAGVAALGIVAITIKARGLWPMALAGVLVAGMMVGGSVYQLRQSFPAPRDVTSNVQDPPAFVGRLAQERRAAKAVSHTPVVCDGVAAIESQMAYQSVGWALDKAGVNVMGASPFRVDGWKDGSFYGVQHDVTVRIRPGRTDIRVAARDGLPLGDQACELARKISDAMKEATAA